MLQILMYAFPSMMMILAIYLFFYRKYLVQMFKLERPRLINLLALTFFLMAVLGFILNLFSSITFVYIWMILSLLMIGFLTFIIYYIIK